MQTLDAATAAFVAEHRGERVERLALMLAGRTDVDAAAALRQIDGWQRLRTKVPSWADKPELRYPRRLSLEQCSGEAAARYKAAVARRLCPQGGVLADLTGGLGVDFSFMAPWFPTACYVERQAELCALARHNFPLTGAAHASVHEADAASFLETMARADLIFMDPARRDGAGRKTVCIEDCEPDVTRLKPLLLERAGCVMLKFSPMLDMSAALRLGDVAELHVVATGGECRELLLVLRKGAAEPRIFCAEGEHVFSFTAAEEQAARVVMADAPDRYLYEPGAAVMKAGAFRWVAAAYGLEKLHPNSHLYTSGRLVDGFPGRRFAVVRRSGFGKRELRDFLQGAGRANLTVRNFPATVAELRKRLRIKEGGDAYWFATTLASGERVLIDCRKV